MSSIYVVIIILMILVCLILSFHLNKKINLNQRKKSLKELESIYLELQENKNSSKPSNINEWSYQRFSNFFDGDELSDKDFNNKISKIYDLIVNKGEISLDNIIKESGCTKEELILKIRYLKNKRKIDESLYIDINEGVIRKCSEEDKRLIEKYTPYIYTKHLQPLAIAKKFPGVTPENLERVENKIIKELSYLDDKYLINGISIDKKHKKIIYYTVEKHKKEKE